MFQLTSDEYKALRFQIGMLNRGRHSKYLPYAFTEQGIAMLSGVLHSQRAIRVNIMIMRAFVRIKQFILTNKELAKKIDELEKKVGDHDLVINGLIQDIQDLLHPGQTNVIGFHV